MAVEKKEAVKALETKAPEVVKPVEDKAQALKAPTPKAKTVEKKPAATKETVKKETVKKEAAPKKEVVKKEVVKKAPATKKTATKKAEAKATVIIEYDDKKIVAKDVLAAATKAFTKAHKDVAIKTIEVYVKPDENVAYYVINGAGSEEYKIEL